MKVPYNWLKKLISIRLSPEVLAEKLTMAGLEVVGIERDPSGDAVFDISVASNRPDCLGIIGIAREVNAIVSSPMSGPKNIKFPLARIKESKIRTCSKVEVQIQDRTLCHRYVARLICNVKIKDSPLWLKKRLRAMGLRPINNVVDVTNYVLMEYGQPLHAFNFSKIKGQKIVVRRAREGEEIVTLDGIKRRLDRSILVVADSEKPQAIAGIIGGMESEVDKKTRDVLLESAYFDPGSIRRASKKLGIGTESSYRFERGGDKEVVLAASQRAVSLIQELAGGEILKGVVDSYPHPFKPKKIYLRLRRIKEIIGVDVEKARIRAIFRALGLKIEKSDEELWRVHIPSFRRDLSLEIDLIEEIARHFGYSRIPATLPHISVKPMQRENIYQVQENARNIMASIGFQEVVNFSFLSQRDMDKVRPGPEREKGLPIPIKNPLSEEQGVMRLSLCPGLLKTAAFNLNRGEKDIDIFEIGKTFFLKNTNIPEEEYWIGALSIEKSERDWRGVDRKRDFYEMKGIIELLLDRLGVGKADFQEGNVSYLKNGSSTLAYMGNRVIGWVGEVGENALAYFDIHEKVFVFEICLGEIVPFIKKAVRLKELPRFPASIRDISIVVPADITHREIVSSIQRNADIYLEKIELLDLYKGEQIPSGHISLTYRLIFRSSQRTLKEEEVNALQTKIISRLKTEFPVELRS